MMAMQRGGVFMQCHACVAIGAVTAPAAVMAEQRISEATAIEKDQHLLAVDQRLLNVTDQLGR